MSVTSDERSQIVRAAWTVLERSGLEGFKVQLVMREAGISARSFYRHFTDKDALLLALLRDEMARAASHLRAAVAAADDPLAKVEAWIRGIIGAAADPRRVDRARLFSSQQAVMRRFPVEVDEGVRLLTEPLQSAVEEGRAMGVFPWAEAPRDAALIYRLAGGSMTDSLADPPGRAFGDIVSTTIGFALRALGVAPP